jgi:cation transport regulator
MDNPPEAVKGLPKHAQEIFVSAFNAAFEQYKGDEAKANQTAWAAVKTKYQKDEETGEWVAKEAVAVPVASLSDEERRTALQSALSTQHPASPLGQTPYVQEIWDDRLVFGIADKCYQMSYAISDGNVVFGEAQEVQAKRVYTPVESAGRLLPDLVREAGQRAGGSHDSRVQKALSSMQEVLAAKSPDGKAVESALAAGQAAMRWLTEQVLVKVDGGQEYPASAYAYVPDPEKPSDWKLRMWENPQQKVTRKQLGAASAALSPGGLRGQKVEIPIDLLASVKRTIRAEYRALDVPDDDIPRWVKEAETRRVLADRTTLAEAQVDSTKGIATITVIRPGFNATKDRYYPKEVLARDFGIFEGVKMYADHPTAEEDRARPERSIKDWVATLKNVRVAKDGSVIGEALIVEPWLQAKLAALRDKKMLSEMGVSINSVGTASKGVIDGQKTEVIERLVRARSVDFVTEPGAGGMVTMYEAGVPEYDADVIGLDALRERRPDLVEQIVLETRTKLLTEVKKMAETEEKIKGLEGQVATLTTERDEAKAKLAESEKAQAKAAAQVTIRETVSKTDLPDAAKAHILEAFKDAVGAEGLEAAIKAEAAYIAKLSESGKVKGMGTTKPDDEATRKALREAFKRMHPEYSEAQLDLAIMGR